MSEPAGEHGVLHEILAAAVSWLSPRLACRWLRWHDWVGEPLTTHCRWCGAPVFREKNHA